MDKQAQKALDYVIKHFFCKNALNSKSCFEISDEEFQEHHIMYYNISNSQFFFGLSEADELCVANALRTSKPNEHSTFPDFICRDGFIEHFQITSSKTTRKGSEQAICEAPILREIKEEQQRLNHLPEDEIEPFTVQSKTWKMEYPEHSYEYLTHSFQKSWEHHCHSLEKYQGKKTNGIFLIENDEIVMNMLENTFSSVKSGYHYGNLITQKSFDYYSLVHDKKMLDYMYSFREMISYVIYKCVDHIEIIKLENIPDIEKLQPWDYYIYPSVVVSDIHRLITITLPNNGQKEEVDNDKS